MMGKSLEARNDSEWSPGYGDNRPRSAFAGGLHDPWRVDS